MMLSESTMAVVMEALEQQRAIAQKDIRLYTSLGNQVTQGELLILEKAKVRLERANAAITELQAAQAGEWRPLGDGEVSSFVYVDNGGKLIGIFAGDDYTDWYATEDLPDHIRLCQRVTIGSQAAGEWSSVEYNDIINDDNGNQLRVVIDQGDSDKRVHLHIRKRVDGKWKHVGVTTVSDDYRLQKRTTIGSQEGRNE